MIKRFNWKPYYKPGTRWRLSDAKSRESLAYGMFDFVILGPDPYGRANYKLCRVEYDDSKVPGHGLEQSYSHTHLKRYARVKI